MGNPARTTRSTGRRMAKDRAFQAVCIGATLVAVLILAVLLVSIVARGGLGLDWSFLTSPPSKEAEKSGISSGLWGTVWLLLICAVTAIPLGVGTAILLEEYKPVHPLLAKLHGFIQLNITNLAGVPSIVYGILGVTAFAMMFTDPASVDKPWATVGQTWYLQYQDLARNPYFVPIEGDELGQTQAWFDQINDPKLDDNARTQAQTSLTETVGLTPDTPLLAQSEPDADAATGLVFVSDDDPTIRETRDAIELDNYDMLLALGDLLNATKDGRRAPVQIDTAKAEEIAEAAIAIGTLKSPAQDVQPIITDALLALDGKKSTSLGLRRLKQELITAELAYAGLDGKIMTGQLPTLQAQEAWYHFQLPFGRGVLAGGLTLMLVILPIIIVASQEAIRAVPNSMRAGCLALGGTKWQSIAQVVLPAAIPGICTGAILAMSRAIGEAAPILLLASVIIMSAPQNLMSKFGAMPLQIYFWTNQPSDAFRQTAATGIIVLLIVLLSFNALAVLIRQKFTQKT